MSHNKKPFEVVDKPLDFLKFLDVAFQDTGEDGINLLKELKNQGVDKNIELNNFKEYLKVLRLYSLKEKEESLIEAYNGVLEVVSNFEELVSIYKKYRLEDFVLYIKEQKSISEEFGEMYNIDIYNFSLEIWDIYKEKYSKR